MQAYMYSPTTHEFLESVPCFPDPVRSRMEGREVYLLPANSTFTEPPAKRTGYIAVWNGSEWIETEDHRGVQYWPKGATHNSASIEMKELGPLPDGASLTRPEQTDEEYAAEAREKRNALIAETDYMAMPDYPLDEERKAAVLAYRQALRDVPEQAGFPRQIDWPVKP